MWQERESPITPILAQFFSFILECGNISSIDNNEEKTKEITAVKGIWICDPNYHKIQ